MARSRKDRGPPKQAKRLREAGGSKGLSSGAVLAMSFAVGVIAVAAINFVPDWLALNSKADVHPPFGGGARGSTAPGGSGLLSDQLAALEVRSDAARGGRPPSVRALPLTHSAIGPIPRRRRAQTPASDADVARSRAWRTYWGTYRSSLYLGMRTKSPKSLLLGMMWYDPQRPDTFYNLRHTAEESHGLASYGWTRHDGESFGVQDIVDGPLRLTAAWAKPIPSEGDTPSGGFGGDFAVRVGASFDPSAGPDAKACVVFYVLDEALLGGPTKGTHLAAVAPWDRPLGGEGGVMAQGRRPDIGGWALAIAEAGIATPAADDDQAAPLSYLGMVSSHSPFHASPHPFTPG